MRICFGEISRWNPVRVLSDLALSGRKLCKCDAHFKAHTFQCLSIVLNRCFMCLIKLQCVLNAILCSSHKCDGNYFSACLLLITVPFLFIRISATSTAKMENQLLFTILFVITYSSTVDRSCTHAVNDMSKPPAKAIHASPIDVSIAASNIIVAFFANAPREKGW